ncbi:lipocalin-like domain-containing protein [Streptomyces canus]|uniref:lipocalin-like domain-containing protein n=1 Tax=Streptomyces canus TaxID=58343 RepID=UPI0037127A89
MNDLVGRPAIVSGGLPPGVATEPGSPQFIGSWRLMSFEARLSDGGVLYPFGRDADGVLTYTLDGRLSAAVWKADRPSFASDDQQEGTPEEYAAALRSYVQYMGTFTVDRAKMTIHHHIEQSVFPNWNGGTQPRFYEFSEQGSRLELTTPPTPFGGQTHTGAVVWKRMQVG